MTSPAILEGPDHGEGWRAIVQRAMLTLAAAVAPAIAVLAIMLRSGLRTWRDDVVMAALGTSTPGRGTAVEVELDAPPG